MSQTYAQLINGKSATVEFSTGSASTPSVAFSGDTNTGIYSPGADQVAISTNGSGRLFVDSNGNVGVGGSVGFGAIDHGIHVTGSGAQEGIRLQTSAGSSGILEVYAESGGATLDTRGSGYIRFNNVATEWARFDSSGRLGIGTSSPSSALDVSGAISLGAVALPSAGTARIFSRNTDSNLYIQTGGGNTLNLLDGSQNTMASFGSSTVTLQTGNSPRLSIDSSGRVGIGTTSPATSLHLLGANTAARGQLSVAGNSDDPRITLYRDGAFIGAMYGDTTNGVSISAESGYSIMFGPGGTSEKARFDSSGKLLVGTSSAITSTKLVVQARTDSATGNGGIALQRGSLPSGADQIIGVVQFTDNSQNFGAIISAVSDGSWTSGSNHRSRLVFSVTSDGASSPTEAMRITNARKVRIDGATVPAAAKLGVTASLTDDNGILIKNSVAQASGQNYMVFYNSSDNLAGSIQHTGATTVNYSTSSDYRLKENVIPVSDAVVRLQQLKPCRFNFKTEPEKTVDGFLAHQVQSIVPEAISGTKDEVDADGKPIYQGIDQSKLVPLLTAALQEAIGEIESLKARVAALESA